MQRIVSLLLVWVLAGVGLAVAEDAPQFSEGKDYKTLPQEVPTRDKAKVEVVELFWYGCPHCYRFDPIISKWQKNLPADVDFWHSPAAFNKTWRTHAQAFYTAEALGVSKKMHQPLFDALARDRKTLNSEDALAKFFGQYQVEEDKFRKAYNSFSVKSKVEQAASRSVSYRATGVPALIVNGKYRIDSGTAGSFERMLKIADFLIAKERGKES